MKVSLREFREIVRSVLNESKAVRCPICSQRFPDRESGQNHASTHSKEEWKPVAEAEDAGERAAMSWVQNLSTEEGMDSVSNEDCKTVGKMKAIKAYPDLPELQRVFASSFARTAISLQQDEWDL